MSFSITFLKNSIYGFIMAIVPNKLFTLMDLYSSSKALTNSPNGTYVIHLVQSINLSQKAKLFSNKVSMLFLESNPNFTFFF